MISVKEALDRILNSIQPLESETIPLLQSLGRVSATDLEAQRTHPPFAVSAMDGYAIRSEDIKALPATLKVIGTHAAGSEKTHRINKGECLRIFTGAPLPENADCIVIQENCERERELVHIREGSIKQGQFVRPAGLDFKKGQMGIPKGKSIHARDIALLASMDWKEIPVIRKPIIGVLASGNELVEPGQISSDHQIVNSNSYGLAAFIHACGGIPKLLGIAKDDIDDIKQKLNATFPCDMIVTMGGASVGEHDLIQKALKEEGLMLDFWRIAMRPGKPLLFGRWREVPILGLPGNPVSVLVTSLIFLKPAIEKMLGQMAADQITEYAKLDIDLPPNDSRQDYLRAKLRRQRDGTLWVEPFAKQDSSMSLPLAKADCLVIRPPMDEALSKGQDVEILTFPPGI